jgi:hypothetical protein
MRWIVAGMLITLLVVSAYGWITTIGPLLAVDEVKHRSTR